MASVLKQSQGDACDRVLSSERELVISAGTVAEALVVAAMRGYGPDMEAPLIRFEFQVVPVTEAAARRVMDIYLRWGKGMHPARLNFADCFAYDVAKVLGCPLLYVGNDFSKTDIASVLSRD